MPAQQGAYVLALSSAVLFSGASVIFARFSSSHSSLWMNLVKNTVAGAAFCAATAVAFALGWDHLGSVGSRSLLYFFLSGVIGLAVGDYFLFSGYQRLGSARTIMVFSFSPVFLTLEGFFLFGQGLSSAQFFALLLMLACVWTISFEKFRERGHWEWRGILYALLGVLLDNVGIVLSRRAFDLSPGTGAFYANAIRAVGAVLPVLILQYWWGKRVFHRLGILGWKDRSLVIFASLFGTFLSLTCWLTALKIGHIGSLAAVGSFNPVAASLWEWALLRKRPTRYLIGALLFFLAGFFLLLRGS